MLFRSLEAGAFPRQRQRPGFHLMESDRQLGDPDPADQDRYALLEALLSAREHLLITWNGLEERTGVTRPPAAPVQHWLQWLQSVLPAGEAEALLVRHPPNPLDPANFLPRGERPPASCDQRLLAACMRLGGGLEPSDPGLAVPPLLLESTAPEAVLEAPKADDPFADLRAWLLAPQREWLRGLGMVARDWSEEVDDLEPLELGERERVALLRDALARDPRLEASPAEDWERWLRRHRGAGRFPPGQGAVLEARRLEEQIGRAHV